MGWFTKKSKRWELKHLLWTGISLLMFIPVPIHVYPIVMLDQAKRSKVRSWYLIGWVLLLFELSLFGSFVYFFGSMNTGMLFTLGASTVSYVIGNGLLFNRAQSYLQRLEIRELRPLDWIPSIRSQRKLALLESSKITPQLFANSLLFWKKEIQNKKIQNNLDRIIRLFQLIEKNDSLETEKFLIRHSTLIQVLKKYDELDKSELNNDMTAQSKRRLSKVVAQSALAIEQEATNLFEAGILELSAESDAYLASLKNRKLLKD
ncbi:MAG TPA: hypothetical protein VK102_02690 [Sphingobacterium sp.]|nr:hypothetical protein [Sphingobacterium sp.]